MTRWPSGASPLSGRYLVKNRLWHGYLSVTDRLLRHLTRRPADAVSAPPRRLLLAVGGHLGDAVIATSVLPLLQAAIPGVEIGMLLGSWAAPAVIGHPRLRWIHRVDHWKPNRTGASLANKWLRHRQGVRRALREIREVGYDAAVDLSAFYPNAAPLLWRTGIPVRIGYSSGGYGPLYTHAVEWKDSRLHTAEQHLCLLRTLVPALPTTSAIGYDLPPIPRRARRRADQLLRAAGTEDQEFVAVHMGAGGPIKEWPRERWRALVAELGKRGVRLVFTGRGSAEEDAAAEVAREAPGSINLCGQLAWPEFVHTLSRARAVLTVDTVAAHLAAAVGVPCVQLWSGINAVEHWRPLGGETTALQHPVSCAPCFRSRGCATMACLRGVAIAQVLEALERHLPLPPDRTAPADEPAVTISPMRRTG